MNAETLVKVAPVARPQPQRDLNIEMGSHVISRHNTCGPPPTFHMESLILMYFELFYWLPCAGIRSNHKLYVYSTSTELIIICRKSSPSQVLGAFGTIIWASLRPFSFMLTGVCRSWKPPAQYQEEEEEEEERELVYRDKQTWVRDDIAWGKKRLKKKATENYSPTGTKERLRYRKNTTITRRQQQQRYQEKLYVCIITPVFITRLSVFCASKYQ